MHACIHPYSVFDSPLQPAAILRILMACSIQNTLLHNIVIMAVTDTSSSMSNNLFPGNKGTLFLYWPWNRWTFSKCFSASAFFVHCIISSVNKGFTIFARPHTVLEREIVFTISWNSKLARRLDRPDTAQKHRCHLWTTLDNIENSLFLLKISTTVRSYSDTPEGSCQKRMSKV
jgi:hypothetical protein